MLIVGSIDREIGALNCENGAITNSLSRNQLVRPGDDVIRTVDTTPGFAFSGTTTWASCLHTCASVTEQYNLVPAKGW